MKGIATHQRIASAAKCRRGVLGPLRSCLPIVDVLCMLTTTLSVAMIWSHGFPDEIDAVVRARGCDTCVTKHVRLAGVFQFICSVNSG